MAGCSCATIDTSTLQRFSQRAVAREWKRQTDRQIDRQADRQRSENLIRRKPRRRNERTTLSANVSSSNVGAREQPDVIFFHTSIFSYVFFSVRTLSTPTPYFPNYIMKYIPFFKNTAPCTLLTGNKRLKRRRGACVCVGE